MRKVYDISTGKTEELPSLPPTPPTKAKKEAMVNSESLAYLASTDWYILRMAETKKSVPEMVLKARAAARFAIK